MKKAPRLTLAAIALLAAAGTGLWLVAQATPAESAPPVATAQSGIQTLDITAKGGYMPTSAQLKAEAPALLRIITQSTFDCSAVLVIPQLGYQTHLPMTGITEINIPPQAAGTQLLGTCGMGMYSFTITFS